MTIVPLKSLKRELLTLTIFASSLLLRAQKVESLRSYEAYTLPSTWIKDSLDVAHKGYVPSDLLTQTLALGQDRTWKAIRSDKQGVFKISPSRKGKKELLSFTYDVEAFRYLSQKIELHSTLAVSLWLDGQCIASQKEVTKTDIAEWTKEETTPTLTHDLTLLPGSHTLEVRLYTENNEEGAFMVSMPKLSEYARIIDPKEKVQKQLDLNYMMQGDFITSVSVSPSGAYALVSSSRIENDQYTYSAKIYNRKGEVVLSDTELYQGVWGKSKDKLYVKRQNDLWAFDVQTKEYVRLLKGLSSNYFMLSGDDQALFVTDEVNGDAKDEKVIRFRDPDDRQPSWRNRDQWSIIDLKTGIRTPLFVGKNELFVSSVHTTKPQVVISSSQKQWEKRPYTRQSFFEYNYMTGELDTLLEDQTSINQLLYLKQENMFLVVGTPNTFEGIGKKLPKDQMGNEFEGELYLWNRKTNEKVVLTKEFDPSVSSVLFVGADRVIFVAENGSRKNVYSLDLKSRKITMLPLKEEYIMQFAMSASGKDAWYYGHGAVNADRLYHLSGQQSTLVWDLDKERMNGYKRPEAYDWKFTATDGTPIEAWYYLPATFDANKQYPMLVYYYGGTSPTRRSMEGAYSLPMFAAQDYVVLTLNPSGTTGYGQEFAARHLNAWGEPTADEIISAVKTFCQEHPFVNSKKIGCFGASYGGFMTQYLQTKTDLFAAAISHAGISNITNYWGSGYWGMGYNEIAAQGSFPWSDKEIFVDRSPLFNADKIKTPLLLLHGDSDTNVPTAESINMYNALKVLGKEVELILFTGQDHFILEPSRKRSWTISMFAWFQRFLKDDPTWWNALYQSSEMGEK